MPLPLNDNLNDNKALQLKQIILFKLSINRESL